MADEPSNGTPLWPGPADLAARLERLEGHLASLEGLRGAVEAALVAQATRIESVLATARRELGDRVAAEAAGAHDAAGEVREALAGARDLTADRLDAAAAASGEVADVVRAALTRVEAALDDRLDEATAGAQAATAPVEALAGAVEALHDLVVDVRAEAAEGRQRVDALAQEVRTLAVTVESSLGEVTSALQRQVGTSTTAVREAAGDAARDLRARLEQAAVPLRDAVATVQSLDTSLRRHVDEMEWRASAERARLTQAFVEQLADGLGRRERRRLARRVELPDRPPEAPALPDEAPAAPEPPATTPSTATAAVAPEAALAVDDVPTWEQPADDPAPDPGDPAAVRGALAAVRGLGPARQSALIDRYGTLAGIRAASDDELLAIPGIGPALLPGIRDAVG